MKTMEVKVRTETELVEALFHITSTQQAHDGTLTHIRHLQPKRGCVYLSGVPYLWTSFGERAFIFRDKEQASQLLESFPELLAGSQVAQFKPQATAQSGKEAI